MSLKQIERKGKRALIRFLASRRRSGKVEPADIRESGIERIVVIRQDYRIGNLIFVIPLIKALKEDWKDAEVHVVTGAGYGSILSRLPEVESVIEFDHKRAVKNPIYYMSFRRALRRMKFDLAVDAGSMTSLSTNNIMTVAACRARYSIGYDRKESSSFLDMAVPQLDEVRHESQALLHIADYLSEKEREIYPRFEATEVEISSRRRIFDELGIEGKGKTVGMHTGGRYEKRWSTDSFIRLAENISGIGHNVLLICGPGETNLAMKIRQTKPTRVHLLDSLSLQELIGVTSGCELFISGDTGPMHIAAALSVPCIQIFRVENDARYGYSYSPHTMVKPVNPPYEVVYEAVVDRLGDIN